MKKIFISIMFIFSLLGFAKNNVGDISFREFKTDKEIKVKDFKKKTYIKIWASWCPICLSTLPHTDELSKMKDLDFQVLTVVSPNFHGEKSKENFKEWWKGLNDYNNISILFDESGTLIRRTNARAFPSNIFIDSKGNVQKVIFGAISNRQIKDIMKNIK